MEIIDHRDLVISNKSHERDLLKKYGIDFSETSSPLILIADGVFPWRDNETSIPSLNTEAHIVVALAVQGELAVSYRNEIEKQEVLSFLGNIFLFPSDERMPKSGTVTIKADWIDYENISNNKIIAISILNKFISTIKEENGTDDK